MRDLLCVELFQTRFGGRSGWLTFPPLLFFFLLLSDALPGEKPRGIKTHLRNMLIVPEMIGSIVGIYNGALFRSLAVFCTKRISL